MGRHKFAVRGFGGIFGSDRMADAKTISERRGYFFDEGEREVKTGPPVVWKGDGGGW
jgi:hypothetical protein